MTTKDVPIEILDGMFTLVKNRVPNVTYEGTYVIVKEYLEGKSKLDLSLNGHGLPEGFQSYVRGTVIGVSLDELILQIRR